MAKQTGELQWCWLQEAPLWGVGRGTGKAAPPHLFPRLGLPVIDKTGLTGRFDLALQVTAAPGKRGRRT